MRESRESKRRAAARKRREVDAHTIGSHVSPIPSGRGSGATRGNPRTRHASHARSQRSSGEHLSQRRSSARALPSVDASPEPLEGSVEYARRTHAPSFAVAKQSKRRMRTVLIALIILAVTAVLALLVGQHVFFKATDANFADVDSNAGEALASSSDGSLVFLLEADLSFANHAKNDDDARAYMLVRLDDDAGTASFLSIPAKTQVVSSEGDAILLDEAKGRGGDAETIAAVAELTGIKANHFVATNAQGLSRLVDAMGGITLDIPSEIDDPNAGTIVIGAGEQTLDGAEALVYLRNANHSGGFERKAADRVAFTWLLLTKALDTQGFDFANLISEASNYVSTDMPTSELMDLANASRPLSDLSLSEAVLPTTESVIDGVTTYRLDAKAWEALKPSFAEGGSTASIDDSAIPIADISIEVRNGANIDGAGARLGRILAGFGYTVDAVGNANDGIIYPETLVVYTDPVYEGAARDIVGEISSGRTVNGGDYYASDSDIIVIIGSDWANAAT